MTAFLSVVSAPARAADGTSTEPLVGTWTLTKDFSSGWVGGMSFTSGYHFLADGTAKDDSTFVGTWSGSYPNYTVEFDRIDGITGGEKFTVTLTDVVTGDGTVHSWAKGYAPEADGTITLTRDLSFDCGAGTFSGKDLAGWGRELGMTDAEIIAWLDDPCGSATLVASVDVHQVNPDQDKADGKNGRCEIASDRVTGYVRINNRQFEVGHAMMVTSFCHDGKIVYQAGTDEAPQHATFQNPSATNNLFLSCTYTGSLDNDFAYGWTDDTKRGFYTTGSIGFTCTGPALALALTAGPAQAGVTFNKTGNAYLTATQTVWQDGQSEFHMGGRS